MEKKQVKIGKPVKTGQVTIIPVVKFSLNYWRGRSRFSCLGIKQPLFIVVVSSSWKRVFRPNGEEIPLEQLIEEIPSLQKVLNAI